MRLFFEDKRPDMEKLRELANTKVSKNGKRYGDIMGFAGTFGHWIEDVWVSDPVEEALKGNTVFMEELAVIIRRFRKDDWGMYTKPTKIWDYNGEAKYFGLDHQELGLYDTSCGPVYLYMNRDEGKSVFYFRDDKEAEEMLLDKYGEALSDYKAEANKND